MVEKIFLSPSKRLNLHRHLRFRTLTLSFLVDPSIFCPRFHDNFNTSLAHRPLVNISLVSCIDAFLKGHDRAPYIRSHFSINLIYQLLSSLLLNIISFFACFNTLHDLSCCCSNITIGKISPMLIFHLYI